MDKSYFIINTGSASKKYALYRGREKVFFAHFEMEGDGFVVTLDSKESVKREITKKDFGSSLQYVLKELSTLGVLSDPKKDLAGVGFRIVAPGSYFFEHRIIDESYKKLLSKEKDEAPLHIAPMLEELAEVNRLLLDVPIVGVSDSAFHVTLPAHAYTYAISHDAAEKFDIRKFGYHGSSFASVVKKTETMLGALPRRIIVCHLGSGSSITAILDGKSVDTSMGFSPLEGVPMATRVGDIDPGAAIHLAESLGFNLEELERYFYKQSGLLGISGESDDVRRLLALKSKGNVHAKLALDTFVYRIQKYIGSYFAVLGGLDLLVFSATIGERSFVMRERICRNLNALGIVLDEVKNNGTISKDALIHKDGSGVSVAVINTDEMGEIFRVAGEILG